MSGPIVKAGIRAFLTVHRNQICFGKRLRLIIPVTVYGQKFGQKFEANVSRIFNKNIGKLSTDLILRVLVAVGGKAKIDSSAMVSKKAG